MTRYVISYGSRTASEAGGSGGTLFYTEDDDAALAIQEALAAVQTPQAWKSMTAAVTVLEGKPGVVPVGTRELRLNVKYVDQSLGFYHFPLVAEMTTHEEMTQLLLGEGADDPAAPVSPQGQPIVAIVKSSAVNMR